MLNVKQTLLYNKYPEKLAIDELIVDGRDSCPWLGVQSFGHIVTGEFSDSFIKEHESERYHIRQGFHSTRGVKCISGKVIVVNCKVSNHGPLPNYVCEANDFSVRSENITTVVSKILKCLGAITKRHWSGYEFFGFHRKDVLKVLKVPNRNCDPFEDDTLKDILNIRVRNAGPTSNLKSKQAIDKRHGNADGRTNLSDPAVRSRNLHLFDEQPARRRVTITIRNR